MNDIFGIPMSGIVTVLLVLLAGCLLAVAWVAWRRPVVFKLGVRNLPRRKAQTTLIVVGLMLSTLIIAAALSVGDTLDHSFDKDVFDNLGHVDEQVVASQEGDADTDVATTTTFDAAELAVVEAAVVGNTNVDGLLPMLETRVPVRHEPARLAEPDVVLAGLDPARLDAFGGLQATDGSTIDFAALDAGSVVLSEKLADELGAAAGDTVTVFYGNQPTQVSVAAVAQDTFLSGVRRSPSSGLEVAGMAMPLAALQDLTGQAGKLSSIAVSNAGGVRDSLDHTAAVSEALQAALAGHGLGVDVTKQDAVETADEITGFMTGLFLVLGLFSIAAGILLIVLIFTVLAAERRPEMGMARAVGMHRRQLIQSFISEGAAYAVVAALIGSLLGVLAAIGIGYGMSALFGDFVPIDPYVTPRSLVAAYALGVVITFLTVVGASWKVSRLNVVAAVRDIPDVATGKRKKMTLVWAGLLLLLGAGLTLAGTGSGTLLPFASGMSLLPFGAALVLRFFGVPSRPIFTTIGLYLLVFWLLPEDQFSQVFGEYDGDIEMFFVSGIFMVIAATIVIVNNLDVLLAGVSRLGGLFRSKLPAVRTAIAYPGAARGRTGMTIAMFSLIVFSLVMIATMNQNFVALFLGDDANAGWDVRADARTANPVTDFEGTLAAAGVDTSQFTAVGQTTSPAVADPHLRLAGDEDASWKEYAVAGMDEGFVASAKLLFGQRARGYESDAAIVEALKTEPNVAVVDAFAIPQGGFGADDEAFQLTGVSTDDEVFDPTPVEIMGSDGQVHTITIIGVLDSKIGSLFGLYTAQPTFDAIYDGTSMTSYFVALDDPDRADAVAKEVESSLLTNGVQATSIRDQLEEGQRQSTGFLYLIQGFMGLGLLVGVAAVGVIAFRNVVERRQQIGVLRALGYQRGMVSLSFVIETAFVVGLGVISGTAMAVVLARNLFTSEEGGGSSDFFVPWGIISVVLLATVAVALLMTWVPSRQAARIAPAEALRYE